MTIIKNNILKLSHSVVRVAQGLRAANDVQDANGEAAGPSHATVPESAQQAMFDLPDIGHAEVDAQAMLDDLQDLEVPDQPELNLPYSSSEPDPDSSEEEEDLDGSEVDCTLKDDLTNQHGQPAHDTG